MDASDYGFFPNKRQKTLTPKGKEIMEEATTGEDRICGICLLGGGLKVRGLIDSCDHYFCFICIMEWAKVESRCPMCKQRFRFIRRPEVPGLFASDSVLEIPIRDQVYHPLGNESTALSESYDQVNCKVCHGTNDDELLLLCDLCDSASHTFCVGLGYAVPEDNWYCHDCALVRDEDAKVDGGADGSDQDRDTNVLDQQQSDYIFEFVADERSFATELWPPQQLHEISLSRSSTSQTRTPESILHAEVSESLPSPAPGIVSHLRGVGQNTRALRHACNMEKRIQELRKHWNALRSGSLVFSSALDCSVETASGTGERTSRTNLDPSQQSKFSTLGNGEQLTDSNISRKKPSVADLQDVNRAWKMMQKAQMMKLAIADSSLMAADKGSTSRTNKHFPIKPVHERDKPPVLKHKFKSSNQSKHGNRLVVKESSSMNRDLMKAFAGVKEVLPIRPSSKFNESTSSLTCTKGLHQDGKAGVSKYIDRSSSKRFGDLDNNAKSDIQSMVRLNLNRLSKGGPLGTDRFKEIARISTHSILATCGFEHSKSCARHFPDRVCRHTGPVQLLHASTIMPGSCRDCFDSFVKDVVSSILLEKSNSNNSGRAMNQLC